MIIKVVNTSNEPQPLSIQLQGMKGQRDVETITLHSDDMDEENTLDRPEKIVPVSGSLSADAGKGATLITDDLPAKTFRIYKVKK